MVEPSVASARSEPRGVFADVIPPHIFDYARATIDHGVNAAYSGPRGKRITCRPHPSVSGKLLEVLEASWKDISAGRVVLGTDRVDLPGLVCIAHIHKCMTRAALSYA